MEKRYYAGLALQKDLDMCKVYDDLASNPAVTILRHGRNVEVVEMKYTNTFSSDREDTGKRHVGFDFHYIVIEYRGLEFHIEPASYYPFTDENDPGQINFIVYKDGKQSSYSEAYESIADIDRWIDKHPVIKAV